jgi:glycosyltransferase involved in cell wall biosynthesis
MPRSQLHIGLLSPPWVAVPPPAYGGTESIVDRIARGLVAAGQYVTLYATGDSTAPVPIAHSVATAAADRMGEGTVEMRHVMEGYEALADCDIVHDHTLVGPAWALACGHRRVVTTCHGPFAGELRAIYRRYGERLPVVAISRDQAARAPEIAIDRVIHHGLDIDQFPVGRGDGGYLLFLGRMVPDKGVREAALLARSARRPLVIAAKMREPCERAYFAEQVRPLLGDDIVFVGEAANGTKLNLLAGAAALLNPIRWPEPFGLVMTEALACGTPVLTRRAGAAPEIVDDGVTGFLCADDAALVQAIERVDELDRAKCRAAVVERFSTERMVGSYIALYRDVMAR